MNFSLIIPHYNFFDLLVKLIATIPRREDMEVIIVDDCSTERHEALLELSERLPEFKWIFLDKNVGGAQAKNIGIDQARGKWILIADPDDVFLPDINSALDDYVNSEADKVVFDSQITDFEGNDTTEKNRRHRLLKNCRFADFEKIRYLIATPWGKIYKKEFLDRNNIRFRPCTVAGDVRFAYLCDYYAGKVVVDPLLNPDICQIMSLVRKYMDKTVIYLVTNGVLLKTTEKLPGDFWDVCRENDIIINVTRYPIKFDYDGIRQICEEKGVRFIIGAQRIGMGGWKETLLNEKGCNVLEFKLGFLKLMKCNSNYFEIVGDRIYPCCKSAYVGFLTKKFKTDFKISKKDYIEIDKLKKKRQLRRKFLVPIPFCKYCPGERSDSEWRVSQGKAEEWMVKN